MEAIKHISNNNWRLIYTKFCAEQIVNGRYHECTPFSYSFNPQTDHIICDSTYMFDLNKVAAMYFWYKNANKNDMSILRYFDEYSKCINKKHRSFNSNYGVYAYKNSGLNTCINALIEDKLSRHAAFCINNNEAMSTKSIDKLCTNTIQFLIREDTLNMYVQMRSSNIITMLPYDAFMFSVFYMQVFNRLCKIYSYLEIGNVYMQTVSSHYYSENLSILKKYFCEIGDTIMIDFRDNNCQLELEKVLLEVL